MIGIVLERDNEILSDYFGCESFLDIPIFHKTFGDCICEQLSFCGCSEILRLSLQNFDSIFNARLSDSNFFLVFSDTSFYIDIQYFEKSVLYLEEFLVCDENGTVCGLYCSKKFLESTFGESQKIFQQNFSGIQIPKIKCCSDRFNIDTCNSYKSFLNKIINSNADFKLPEIAEGIYSPDKIPKGDYVIIPPVYIGEGVQIEKNCVIGPHTIIGDNVLVASGSVIKNSVLLNDVYISDNCFSEDVLYCKNSSVRRNTCLFSGTVVGSNSIIPENYVLENGTFIIKNTELTCCESIVPSCNTAFSCKGTPFYGYTPQKTALLGSALGNVLAMPNVAVMSDAELNSTALKLAVLSGLLSVGARCFDFGKGYLSSVFYFMDFCEIEWGIFISGNSEGTVIYVVSHENKGLSYAQLSALNRCFSGEQIRFCDENQCKKIRVITSLGRLYVQSLLSFCSEPLIFYPRVNCDSKCVKKTVAAVLSKIEISEDSVGLQFNINSDSTSLSLEYKNRHYTNDTIDRMLSFYSMKLNEPAEYKCFNIDAVAKMFRLLHFLSVEKLSPDEAEERLPRVYIAEKETFFDDELSKLSAHISEYASLSYENGVLKASGSRGEVEFIKKRNDKNLKMNIKAYSTESAEELAADLVEYIKRFTGI